MRLYQVTSGASTTRMGYDGLNRIAEYDAGNAVLRRYIHGPGVDQPIAWYEGSGAATRRFLSADERGSIIAVTDSAGAIVAKNTYDEYGIPKSDQGTLPVAGRFAYTGQIWLPELGMYHYKARLYSPTLGRFMQTDPIGYDDQINLYAYVGGDPVNKVDPDGKKVTWVFTGNYDRRVQTKTEKYLSKSSTFQRDYGTMKRSKIDFTVVVTDTANSGFTGQGDKATITFNPMEGIVLKTNEVQSPAMGFAHEVAAHGAPFAKDPTQPQNETATSPMTRESTIANELGEPTRDKYGDTKGTYPAKDVTTHGPLEQDPKPYNSPDDTKPM